MHVSDTLVGSVVDPTQHDQLNAKNAFLLLLIHCASVLPTYFDALMLALVAGTLVQPQHQSCPAIRSPESAWRLVAEVDLP